MWKVTSAIDICRLESHPKQNAPPTISTFATYLLAQSQAFWTSVSGKPHAKGPPGYKTSADRKCHHEPVPQIHAPPIPITHVLFGRPDRPKTTPISVRDLLKGLQNWSPYSSFSTLSKRPITLAPLRPQLAWLLLLREVVVQLRELNPGSGVGSSPQRLLQGQGAAS